MVTAWGMSGAIAAAARLPAPTKVAPAATARNRRRVGSRGGNIMGWSIADVFVGGVLSTLSAWSWDLRPSWLGLEPGWKFQLPLGLIFVYTNNHGEAIKNCTQKIPGPSGRYKIRRDNPCAAGAGYAH